MKIPIVFLGTSQAVPTATRNHTSILLNYKSENILIDCGEGTQRQFRIAKLNPCKLTRILITHFHGDHVLGLPGLLQTLALNNYSKTLYIYGPKKTKEFIKMIQEIFLPVEKIKIKVEEVEGKFLETKDFELFALPLFHSVPCNGYLFKEKDKLKIHKNKLEKLKIKSSPELAKIVHGKNIKVNGKVIKYKDLTYLEKGKKIGFVFDTALTLNIKKLIKDSDLAIIESTYSKSDVDLARKFRHLTTEQAAMLAKENNVKQLILSHISQRYEHKEDILLKEARKVFKKTRVAKDFDKVEI
jgi:ribonuclease Z